MQVEGSQRGSGPAQLTACNGRESTFAIDLLSFFLPSRCHFCDAQLKCEHEGGTIRSEKIDCEYDPGVLDREVDFECPITNGKADCDWNDVLGKLPGECGGWMCLGRRCGMIGCTGL